MNLLDTIDYDDFVAKLEKNPHEINAAMTGDRASMLHAALGICSEAGELADPIKAHVMYNKLLDRENVIEEMGDLEFFLSMLRQQIGRAHV